MGATIGGTALYPGRHSGRLHHRYTHSATRRPLPTCLLHFQRPRYRDTPSRQSEPERRRDPHQPCHDRKSAQQFDGSLCSHVQPKSPSRARLYFRRSTQCQGTLAAPLGIVRLLLRIARQVPVRFLQRGLHERGTRMSAYSGHSQKSSWSIE